MISLGIDNLSKLHFPSTYQSLRSFKQIVFHEFAKSRAMHACVPTLSTWQRACVPAWFTCQRVKSVPSSHFYVPTCHKARQCFNLACQRAKRRATFSIWHVNVPNGVPLFQTFLLRNAKKICILYYYMKNSTLYLISYLYISCVYVSYI